MLRKLVMVLSLLFSTLVSGTADVERPEDVLDMLRLFLSNSIVSADVQEHAEKGCVWVSENIWSGSGSTNENGQKEFDGGFTIYYRTKGGLKKELRYFYSVTVSGENKYLSSVEHGSEQKISPDCSD